ncbi:MAG: class I SAM-dependent rRNA methyltransferase [Chitinophagales bacterium]
MQQIYPKISLKASKVAAVHRRHPWIFSGAIQTIEGQPKEGEIVSVFTPQNRHIATGYYSKQGSISVRVLTFEEEAIDLQFWKRKLQQAYDYRKAIGLIDSEQTNVFRLVNAEGDGLSGLIIDYYNGTAVLQAHSVGIFQQRHEITAALKEVMGAKLKAVYDKSLTFNKNEQKNTIDEASISSFNPYLLGNLEQKNVSENGHLFKVDWEKGQKTGFFIDQRDNRQLLAQYVADKSVLNTFCYSGGFSVYALKAGASLVHSVDSSQKAIDWTDENVLINNLQSEQNKHQSFTADVMTFLSEPPQQYDVIVLDPPAFAKSLKARHRAMKAYRRLNAKALKQIKSGGILFTFSCSGVVERQLFEDTVRSAAIEVGRTVRILHYLSQPADHPINIFHPEGHYLKGLVLYVN